MGIFCNRRPRGYHHVMIYSDERKERLKALEERAMRELGMSRPDVADRDRLRGVFAGSTGHLRRIKEREGRKSNIVLIVLIAAMLLLMHWLITGDLFM